MFSGTKSKGKIFVGLSGGVDSAVSAALLQEQGYEVTGVFIKIQIPGYPCPAADDRISAQRVAAHLRIPFMEIDLSKEYELEVFETAIAEFKKGRTPNPDTLCNQKIKFGAFYEFAKSRGADFIATGHYSRLARTKKMDGGGLPSDGEATSGDFSAEKSLYPESAFLYELLAGVDTDKDQSYFLWMVPETTLRYTIFPVGDRTKKEVRRLAQKFGLPNAARKDSQGLCFLGDISLERMLERELAPVRGEVLNEAGAVVGAHRGAALYTLGERRGFELYAQTPVTLPHFVVAKDIAHNTITVSSSRIPLGKSKTKLTLSHCNWIGPYFAEATKGKKVMARYRYRGKLIPAILARTVLEDSPLLVTLLEPHFVPEGQSLVLYEGERCLGGGVVDSAQLQ